MQLIVQVIQLTSHMTEHVRERVAASLFLGFSFICTPPIPPIVLVILSVILREKSPARIALGDQFYVPDLINADPMEFSQKGMNGLVPQNSCILKGNISSYVKVTHYPRVSAVVIGLDHH